MDVVLFLKTIVVFAALLGVLVYVHELGHFTVARMMGMAVPEFAFGFGPLVVRLFRRNGTDFTIHAIPLGGFVKIAGMDPGEDMSVEGGFNTKPIWKRSLVILAGPVMSLLLGYVVFILFGFIWGFTTFTTNVEFVMPKSPAALASIQKGDKITSVDGVQLRSGTDLQSIVGESNGRALVVTAVRQGKSLTFELTPNLQEDPNTGQKSWKLGVGLGSVVERVGLIEAVHRGSKETLQAVSITLRGLFSRKIKENAGGIVAIGKITQDTLKYAGLQGVLMELAMLSLTLGIINLIPMPVLDGGHLLLLLIEKLRRGKRLAVESYYAIQMVGLAVLIFLAVLLVFSDIAKIHAGKL